ncbi:YbgA family protein [Kaarinaea lacus]
MSSNRSHNEIFIGISSCLLGQKVRFDGNHKQQKFITEELAEKFTYIPVCPEMAIGLGVPRTPIHLVGDQIKQRAVNVKDESIDVTQRLVEFGQQKAGQLDFISGYIFKKGSPSCGLFNVKIYKSPTSVLNSGVGLYAQQIIEANPLLPVEEEGRLKDMQLRANFLQRVEVYHRWQQLVAGGLNKNAIVHFHTQHKFMILAHCESTYRKLGRMISGIGGSSLSEFAQQYITLVMESLKKTTSRGKQSNVLEHIFGFFKRDLDKHDKAEMQHIIAGYRQGMVPRIVPVTMLKHYLRKYPSTYLRNQYYLNQCYSDI